MHPIFSREERFELQATINRFFAAIPTPRILEAGCGSANHVTMPKRSHITGIDISQRELDANMNLSEKILGDIQTYNLSPEEFHLITCWDVLEHLPFPEKALQSFVKALKPGGMLLLKFPNRNSLKARVTKLTPYWFHQLTYQYVYGSRYGSPGAIPFPTYFRSSIAPDRIESFAKENALDRQFHHIYESKLQYRFREKLRIRNGLIAKCEALVRWCSCSTLTLTGSECVYLFRKETPGVTDTDETNSRAE